MFCNDCGTRNSADSKYCKECGSKVNDGYRTLMLTVEDLAAIEDDENQQRLTRLLDMAFWHNEAGHTDAAIRASEAALKIHPLCTTAHSLLGTLYEKQGNDLKAIEHFEEVVRLNPESAADAAKLEQVRQGIHVRAVAQSRVPMDSPALAGLNVGALSGINWQERLRKPNPILVSGAAALLVLTAGWAAIKATTPAPHGRVASASNSSAVASPTPPPAVAGLPYGTVAPLGAQAPVVLKSRSTPGTKVASLVPQFSADGPFGEVLPPGTPTAPLARTSRSVRQARVLPHHNVGAAGDTLPPLPLSAVPLPDQGAGLPPMPISSIAPVPAPTASVAPMPQHTVVVSRLASADSPMPASSNVVPGFGGAPPASGASGPIPPSHIHISISNSPSSDSNDGSPRRTDATGGGDGDAYQQSALDLQNQGDFRHARTAYQKAIHAYKAQIASGHDAETAQRGLQASQTGLQICDQSQP